VLALELELELALELELELALVLALEPVQALELASAQDVTLGPAAESDPVAVGVFALERRNTPTGKRARIVRQRDGFSWATFAGHTMMINGVATREAVNYSGRL
jgi:hypothetical protein